MHHLPVAGVSTPDTVHLSGHTTLKAVKSILNWTVSGFDICLGDTLNIRSPVFSHPNSSKWCMELERNNGKEMLCFSLVASNDSQPMRAILKASMLDQDDKKHDVYPAYVHNLKVNERSPLKCLTNHLETKVLGEDWTFVCEVCTVDVVTEETSYAPEEDVDSALAKDLEQLLDSKDFTDVTLSAGDVRMEAHRAIVCARSPVFRAMLSHDTREAREDLVEIPDIEPAVVLEMLRYMYTDRVQVPMDMTMQLLMASDKYGLQGAKVKCEQELAKQLTVETVADIAACAIVHSCNFLQKMCVAFIKHNLEQVVGTEGWANIIDKCPKVVKTICELVTEGSGSRCSLPHGSQLDVAAVNSSAVDSTSEHLTTPMLTVWDTSYTRCERKKAVYVWTISGMTNWPQDKDFVVTASFCHPETIKWEVRLYKPNKYCVGFKLLENKSGGSVRVDLGISIGEEGDVCTIDDVMYQEGTVKKRYFELLLDDDDDDDALTLKCGIGLVCVVQQRAVDTETVLQTDLGHDLLSLLQSGNFADFKLCVGTAEMGAHRAILVARSPFFACKLQPDSEVLKKGVLDVSDVKLGVLAEVLHYMYTGKVKNLSDSTVDLLVAAHKFELCDLKRQCVTYLSSQLTVSNAITAAVCAIENQCDALLHLSLGLIRSHFKQLIGTNEWTEAIDRHPAAVKRISQLLAGLERRH